MDEFVRRIVESLTTDGRRLSVVRNPDGFLLGIDTQQKVLTTSGLLLLPVNNLLTLKTQIST